MANNAYQLEAAVDRGTILTTELNSLGTGSLSSTGTVFNNSSGSAVMACVELVVTLASSPSVSGAFELYMMRSFDGTNYEDGASTTPGPHRMMVGIPYRVTSSQQRLMSPPFMLIEPCRYSPRLNNTSSVAFGTTGNTLRLWTWRPEME